MKDKSIFKKIFLEHWGSFKRKHLEYENAQYNVPVQKMLDWGDANNGYTEYRCTSCGLDKRRIAFT